MSFHDDDNTDHGGSDHESDISSLARSRTTEVVDSSIKQKVEEIDGVLEEMRELSMLRGMRCNDDGSQSELSTDASAHGNDIDLALELNLADESFRQSQQLMRPSNLPPTNAYFQRRDSEDEEEIDDMEDAPIAVSIGEQSIGEKSSVSIGEQSFQALNRISLQAVETRKANIEKSFTTKETKVEKKMKRRTSVHRISFLLMTVGVLIILVTALLIVKQRNAKNTSLSSSASSFNSATESNTDEIPGAEAKLESISTSNPTVAPTRRSRTPTVAPSRATTRFPSTAPVVATDLPTVSATYEEYLEDPDDDGSYYHEDEKEKSRKGKGSGNVVQYRDWE